MVAIGRNVSIFSDIIFKMAAWWSYWIVWFPDSNFSLALNINSKLQLHYVCVDGQEAYELSAESLSKCAPGRHIRFLGFWTLHFEFQLQTSVVQYLCIWVKVLIFSSMTFKMATWWPNGFFGFWTLPSGEHIEFFSFPTKTLVWLWILTPNFNSTIFVYMVRSLLIFNNVIFKMANWQAYCFVFVSGL